MDNQQLIGNNGIAGSIDWLVVWHYTIILLLVIAAIIIAWVLVNLLFESSWRAAFVRAIGLGRAKKN